jgi:hypothetical protein
VYGESVIPRSDTVHPQCDAVCDAVLSVVQPDVCNAIT